MPLNAVAVDLASVPDFLGHYRVSRPPPFGPYITDVALARLKRFLHATGSGAHDALT